MAPQYAKLEELYEKYGKDDFVVVGFPANNFLHQEPGTNEEIKEFCTCLLYTSKGFDVCFQSVQYAPVTVSPAVDGLFHVSYNQAVFVHRDDGAGLRLSNLCAMLSPQYNSHGIPDGSVW